MGKEPITDIKARPAPAPNDAPYYIGNVFRVRHRVKAGTPEAAGSSIETLASHVDDTNAHPDYLKKGGAIPTGQEAFTIAKHTASQVAHAPVSIRRAETLKTKNEYDQAKSTDYVDIANNYFAGHPIRHVVTAYVLNQILADYVDVAMFKNVIKRRVNIDGTMGPVGDGSQLIYIEDDADGFGYAVLSNKTIGSNIKPVFLSNGTITASTGNVGNSKKPIFMEAGTLKASDATEGSGINPVFLSGGAITKSTSSVGSATQPVFLSNGTITAGTESVGNTTTPVYLNSGIITTLPYTVVTESGSLDQTITGVKTFQSIPKIYNVNTLPQDDVDFVTVAYLSKHTRIPVGGIYTHSEEIPLTGVGSVNALLGYGTWSIHAYIGNAAVMYRRVS